MTAKEFAKKIIASINPGNADISDIGDGTIKGAIREQNNKLGGLKFGTDGDGNYGYYGADDSLIPFKSGGNLGDIITIGTYTTETARQVDCTSIPNYDKLTVDNFMCTNISEYDGAYLQWGNVSNGDSYNSSTGVYTIGQKTRQVTGSNPYYISSAIKLTLKCIPYI